MAVVEAVEAVVVEREPPFRLLAVVAAVAMVARDVLDLFF
jgi:hypothetical protein